MTTTRLQVHHTRRTAKHSGNPARRVNPIITLIGAVAALLATAACQPTPPASPDLRRQDDREPGRGSAEQNAIAPDLRKLPAPNPPKKATKNRAGRRTVTDRSCRVDEDCVVKNVGNCCGRHPQCVNRNFQPNPAAVQAACREQDLMSTCGFVEIAACHCVADQCQSTGSYGAIR